MKLWLHRARRDLRAWLLDRFCWHPRGYRIGIFQMADNPGETKVRMHCPLCGMKWGLIVPTSELERLEFTFYPGRTEWNLEPVARKGEGVVT